MFTLPKILEYVWLAVAIVCLIISVRITVLSAWLESWQLYLITLVAWLMFFFRRSMNQRKKSQE